MAHERPAVPHAAPNRWRLALPSTTATAWILSVYIHAAAGAVVWYVGPHGSAETPAFTEVRLGESAPQVHITFVEVEAVQPLPSPPLAMPRVVPPSLVKADLPPLPLPSPPPLPPAPPILRFDIPDPTADRLASTDPAPAAKTADEPPEPAAAEPAPPVPPESGATTGAIAVDPPAPVYPAVSRRRGEEGLIVLEVDVTADGQVADVRVLRTPGYPLLVGAAVKAVRKARFRPALRDGRPVASTLRLRIRFVLE